MKSFLLILCMAVAPVAAPARTNPRASLTQQQDSESVNLPDGEGKKILEMACTSCHNLKEVTKFKGYNNRQEWKDIVLIMVDYGAQVDSTQVDVLVDYLTKYLGPAPNETPR